MPSMIVCPVSSWREKRKDGSSAASFTSASDIFCWSALVLGSTATLMAGSGKSIFLRITALFLSHRVSPMVVSLRPTRVTMSLATAVFISVHSLACISSMRPMCSFLPLTEL